MRVWSVRCGCEGGGCGEGSRPPFVSHHYYEAGTFHLNTVVRILALMVDRHPQFWVCHHGHTV